MYDLYPDYGSVYTEAAVLHSEELAGVAAPDTKPSFYANRDERAVLEGRSSLCGGLGYAGCYPKEVVSTGKAAEASFAPAAAQNHALDRQLGRVTVVPMVLG